MSKEQWDALWGAYLILQFGLHAAFILGALLGRWWMR